MALRVNNITKWDKIIIVLSLMTAFLLLAAINIFLYCGTATGVEISVDGKLYSAYSFSELPREKTLEIRTDIGYNVIKIADNTVCVINSSCGDGLCENSVISKPNQTIVCLPNKLTVRLVGKSEVDSVSY